ncbi:glycosyl hydrolase family 18 protein [Nitzschia inconspicua]|uniref:Glycosyl hydrolase family 18 protein n=1 Tax=Nitzschia inconspicua TaxID=303405 RepID=A0A9K3Q2B4_9STRA|nr:glycosyl hydrolase family 18 protein [Nitzschia inconspicua]
MLRRKETIFGSATKTRREEESMQTKQTKSFNRSSKSKLTSLRTFSMLGIWLGLLFAATNAVAEKLDDSNDNFAIAAYLPDYRAIGYLEQQLQLKSQGVSRPPILSDLILFSLQPHSKGFLGGCCLQQEHYSLAQKFQEQIYTDSGTPLTLWVTVGGSGRSDAFPQICRDEKLRKRVIQSVINLCNKHSIQGVDLDYTPRSVTDRDQYVVFLQEAIQQWHDAGLKVSMTIIFHPGMPLLTQIYNQVDRLHLMAYDMFSRDASTNDPYHASLAKTKEMLEALLQPGRITEQTRGKVLLGIPAYARHLEKPGLVKTFGEIYDIILQENDADERSVDWYNLSAWNSFEWESGQRIRDKVHLATTFGLGGVFFWEIGQDKVSELFPGGVLLEAAAAAVNHETAAGDGASNGNGGEL